MDIYSGKLKKHSERHVKGGSDPIDGDHLDITFDPSNYTPTTGITEADNLDHLSAHLAGIDAAIGGMDDRRVKVSSDDSTPSFLDDKVKGTTNKITVITENGGGNENLTINIGSHVFDKTTNTSDNITEGSTNLFNVTHTGEVTGSGALTVDKTAITNKTTVAAEGGDFVLVSDTSDSGNLKKVNLSDLLDDSKNVKVSSNDTTEGFLEDKITGTTTNITVTTINEGGDELLQIDVGTNIFCKSSDDSDSITEGSTKLFNVTHTGEVTGSGALTVDKTAITNKATISAESGDFVLVSDTSDSGNLKKVNLTDLLDDSKNVKVSSNDTTEGFLEDKITGTTTNITVTTINEGGDELLQIDVGTNIFCKSSDDSDSITEGSSNLFNVTHTGEVTGSGALTVDKTAITNKVTVAAEGGDFVLVSDTSDSGNLKKVNLTDLLDDSKNVKVSSNDTTEGFLEDKITGTTTNITVTTINEGGDELLQIDVGTNIFCKSSDDSDSITEGSTNLFNVTHTGEVTGSEALTVDKTAITNKTTIAGASGDFILVSDTSDSGNLKKVDLSDLLDGSDVKDLKVSSNDTTPSFLEDKLSGETNNIVITTENEGGNEVLKVDIGDNIFCKSTDDTDDITIGVNNKFNLAHIGEVTGTGSTLTVDKTAITNKDTVTPVDGDFILVSDSSDSGNLKKVDASDFLDDVNVKITSSDTVSEYLRDSLTGTTGEIDVNIIDKGGGNEALKVGLDAGIFELISSFKAGTELESEFSGNPKTADVTFSSPYPDTDYTVVVTVRTTNDTDKFVANITDKTTTGFSMSLGTNSTTNLVAVDWFSMKHE